MSIKKHPAYQKEAQRLNYTKDKIKETLERIATNKEKYQQDMKQAMLDLDYLDSSQSYITILTTSQFMNIDKEHAQRLQNAQDKPYFSRIDFKATDAEAKKFYIGKLSLVDDKSKEPIIIDWRSPIANLYYEGRLGEVSYKSPQGLIEGDLLLKRQYSIEDGQLEDIIDVDITTNDTFLQASVKANADNRLKDIAATIQAEQNKIIRAELDKPLIVQGVAGSGKTTIALHRIAYLIYTYEDKFIPENFVIIAPNSLFINYISEVLPELGVERISQTTYVDLIFNLLGKKYKLTNSNAKLIKLISENNIQEMHLLAEMTKFKGSMDFKSLLDSYVAYLVQDFVPKEDFSLENHVILSYEEIQRLFVDEYNFLPLYKRVDSIKKILTNKLKAAKQKIIEKIEDKYNKEIELIRYSMEESEETRLKLVGLADERDEKLKYLKKPVNTLIKQYLNKFPKYDLMDYYSDIITNPEKLNKFSFNPLDEKLLNLISNQSKLVLEKKQIEFEDLAPLLYLKYKLFGFKEKMEINHVVIDEAQDLSILQFYVLKTVLNTNLFTILGDIAQGIHSYRGINDWQEVIANVFTEQECQYLTLEQSYRTTIEIMNFANKIIRQSSIPNLTLANPVIRHGDKPELLEMETPKKVIEALAKKIKELDQQYKSLAVVCKTDEECKKTKEMLQKKGVKAKILTGNEKSYEAGVVIVPSYVAKGLEFDVVFIVALEEQYNSQDLDIKLLYIAITRAMHKLFIYYTIGNMSLL